MLIMVVKMKVTEWEADCRMVEGWLKYGGRWLKDDSSEHCYQDGGEMEWLNFGCMVQKMV